MSLMKYLRTPYFYLVMLWVSLILLGANLAIDIFAIPINFRLEEHSMQAAAAYGVQLFTTFFRVETYFLNVLIVAQVLSPKASPLKIWGMLHYGVTALLLFYLVYQRQILLPEFIQRVNQGDTTSLHRTLSNFEMLKVTLLLVSAVLSHRSYRQYQ